MRDAQAAMAAVGVAVSAVLIAAVGAGTIRTNAGFTSAAVAAAATGVTPPVGRGAHP